MIFVEPVDLHGDALRHWVSSAASYAPSLLSECTAEGRDRDR